MTTPPPLPRPPFRAPHIEWPTAIVLCMMLAALTAVWALASPEQQATMLSGIAAVGGTALALMRAMLREQEQRPPAPPTSANGIDRDPPAELLEDGRPTKRRPTMLQRAAAAGAVVGLASLLLTGCGAGALQTHQTIARVARIAVITAKPAIDLACDTMAARCTDQQCLDRVEHDCTVAGEARDTLHGAVRAYVGVLQTAAHVDEGAVRPALDTALQVVAGVYNDVRDQIHRLTGYLLPALPPEALAIIRALVGEVDHVTGGAS